MDPQSSSQSSDTSSVLRNATFTHSDSPASSTEAVTSSDLLLGAYDPTKLHPLAGLEDKLDYLLLEDDKVSDLPGAGTAIPSRGWSDDLSYGTGTMYLSGSYLVPFSTYQSLLALTLSNLIPPTWFSHTVIASSCLIVFPPSHVPLRPHQVSPSVDFGAYVRARENSWQCPIQGCGSMQS